MNAIARSEQIIERMKVRKFDTAYNLAFELGVSERTIRNDVMELSISGHPIQADAGRGGGIKWTGGEKRFPFSTRELFSLQNAIVCASPEDKPVLENLIRQNIKPKFDRNGIFGILKSGITQRALAVKLGISESYLSRVLSGQRKPSAKLVEQISKYKEADNGH